MLVKQSSTGQSQGTIATDTLNTGFCRMNAMKVYFEIEDEFQKMMDQISSDYEPGAIKYIDEKYAGAWSKAFNKFDEMIQSDDAETMLSYAEIYKGMCLKWIWEYKDFMLNSKAKNFLSRIKLADKRKA